MKRFICMFLCAVMIFSLCVCVSADGWKNPFKDVKEGEWYYDHVRFTAERGLLLGVEDDVFGVDMNMTRAMFVTVLGRLYGAPDEKDKPTVFTDVPTGQWYSGYVGWAAENRIVFGTSKTEFSPEAPISRQDMCVIAARYADVANVPTDPIREAVPFDDSGDISAYAVNAVVMLQRAGVINGIDTRFEPKGISTRAQVAVVIKKLVQLSEGELPIISINLEEPPEKDPGTPVIPAMAQPATETDGYTAETVWEAEFTRPMTDHFIYTENYMVTIKATASEGRKITDNTAVVFNGVKLEKGYTVEGNTVTIIRKYLLSGSTWHY